jgi:hypothetical protein
MTGRKRPAAVPRVKTTLSERLDLDYLRGRMAELGISQGEIADRRGVGKWHVCHVLAGRVRSEPILETIRVAVLEAETKRATQRLAAVSAAPRRGGGSRLVPPRRRPGAYNGGSGG